jgi:replication fork protection complex subunit Tof1/Swi1
MVQSEYIVQLSAESIFDLLLAIASNAESSEYAPWNMVALDIFHLIFRGVKPPELMVAAGMVRPRLPLLAHDSC